MGDSCIDPPANGKLGAFDEVIRRGDAGLGQLVRAALGDSRRSFFVEEERIEFGPCVTNPEKIVCVGLNYARQAREAPTSTSRSRS